MSDHGGGSAESSWIGIVPASEAEGALAEVYDRISGGRDIAHILGVQSLHPEALSDHDALYRTLMFGPGELPRAEREAIAVAVSAANRCRY